MECKRRTRPVQREKRKIMPGCAHETLEWRRHLLWSVFMQVDLYGLTFETPRVTFYLYSPWRASALEHRLFDAVRHLPGITMEQENPDEVKAHIADVKTWKPALMAVVRVLKGWQED